MITKNHDIQLKDTSEAEMARFRQIMLGIWRQQIEEDKNAKLVGNSLNGSQLNNTNLISVRKVAKSIKKHLGQNHKLMLFNTLIEEEPYPFNIPMNAENLTYTDNQGNQKSGVILLKWISFTGINLIPKTFQASIEIGHEHTDFSLTIFQNDLKEIAFKFIVHDFDLFMALFVELGIKYTDIANQAIIDLYLKKIKEANDDPDKLDVIYQSFPKIMFGKMDDTELYKHLDLILKSMYQFGGSTGTNEDKAILQILYAINDRQTLYTILRDSDSGLLFNIYKKLQGEEAQDFLRFLTRLTEEFDKSKPDDVVYFDNSYYLFRDTHLKTNWADGNILLDNYKNATKITLTKEHKNPMEIYAPEYYIKNKSFNPLTKLNFGTKLGDLGEQVGDENTFVLALKLHNMATKQSNWDLFNIATDLLSLISGGAALRLVLAKGAPIAARALAGLTLAKDAAHYAMLSDGTLEKWHANGFGWLANLWVAFSVTVDLASFGLPNISKIAREGNAAAELAETAEEASEIRRVANEANRIVEVETGKDVSQMTKKEYEDFFDYLAEWNGNPKAIKKNYLGAQKLSRKELKAYLRKINQMSNGKSKLVIVPKKAEVLQGRKAGFHAFSGTLYVEKGATEYEVFHEFKHFEEFIKIGRDEYLKGALDITQNYVTDAIRTYKREKYVFDEIMKNKSKFNERQLKDAQDYMNSTIKNCEANNVDITKIK